LRLARFCLRDILLAFLLLCKFHHPLPLIIRSPIGAALSLNPRFTLPFPMTRTVRRESRVLQLHRFLLLGAFSAGETAGEVGYGIGHAHSQVGEFAFAMEIEVVHDHCR
jgi:hypothetical protein